MTAKMKQWSDSDAIAFFCRHLVGLCVTYERDGDDSIEFAAYSGTLILVEDNVFFLTAGHILKDLDEVRKRTDIKITSAVLADTFGHKRISNLPIPFDLNSAHLIHIDDDNEGLDFGVIPLSPYYVRLLAKNGVISLQEENWVHQQNVRFDAHAMLGFPEEFSSKQVNDAGEAIVSPTMFRVHRQDALPEDSRKTSYERFVGKIDRDNPIQSVKGMSGGPIFGFKIDGDDIRYWVVALQSSWNPSTRIVYGCPLPTLASLLTKAAKGELMQNPTP